jgi:CubicO group peptidase (beta-lactamase class C family)
VPGGFHVYPEMAAAGLWTTASDLARWAIALSHSYRGEPGGVLSTSMAKQMLSKQMHQQPPYGNGYWGLGVAVAGEGDSLLFTHNGRDEGFVADMYMWPNKGRGFVVMTNGVAGALMTEIERSFAEEYGLSWSRTDRTTVPLSASKLGEYAGHYRGSTPTDSAGITVSATSDGKMLLVYNPVARRSIPIAPVGGETFVGLEGGGEWVFERDGSDRDGPVRRLATGIGGNRRVFVK